MTVPGLQHGWVRTAHGTNLRGSGSAPAPFATIAMQRKGSTKRPLSPDFCADTQPPPAARQERGRAPDAGMTYVRARTRRGTARHPPGTRNGERTRGVFSAPGRPSPAAAARSSRRLTCHHLGRLEELIGVQVAGLRQQAPAGPQRCQQRPQPAAPHTGPHTCPGPRPARGRPTDGRGAAAPRACAVPSAPRNCGWTGPAAPPPQRSTAKLSAP